MSSPKKNKTNLVTGCAGFIGFHLTIKLLDQNQTVIGIDNDLRNIRDEILGSVNQSLYLFTLK